MTNKNSTANKNNKSEPLTLNSKYGGIYFVMSIAVIIFVILLIGLTIATKNVALVYVVASIGIIYCAALFVFELKRNKQNEDEKKQTEKIEKDIEKKTPTKKGK